jgi:hypothetical protein
VSTGKTLAVAVLSVLLVGSLAGASAAIGADRTAFDADYVVETLDDENVHGSLAAEIRANATENVEQTTDPGSLPPGVAVDLDAGQALNESITDDVVREQLEAHVRELYAYLRGDSEELSLVTNLTTVRESLRETIIDATTIDAATLVGESSEDIESERVAKLSESEQAYQEAQMTLPPGERERIEEDLEATVRENLSGQPDPLVNAVLSLQSTVLDGLTGELTHEKYVEQLAADEQRVKEEIAAAAITEVPEEQPVFADDEDPESQFAPFRTAVGWGTTLAWLLPLLALVLVAGVYGVTRSLDRTAAVTAGALFWAGLTWVVLGLFARGLLLDPVEPGEASNPLVEGLFAVFEGTLQTIGAQSVLLLVVGAGLYVVVVADRRGTLDPVRERAGYPPRK